MMAVSARRLWARLRRPRQGALPSSAAAWNAGYASGRWAYLGQLPELARFSVLVGYMTHLKPGGSVLDIGCGAGVLYERMQPHGYSRYVGVDLSSSAIAQIAARDERSTFLVADGEQFVPEGEFGITVFNEVLYLFRDPVSAVRRYARSLEDGGIVLVSICTSYKGATDMLDRVKREFPVLDETRATHGNNSWSWQITVLQP